jgi:hypothetical protein
VHRGGRVKEAVIHEPAESRSAAQATVLPLMRRRRVHQNMPAAPRPNKLKLAGSGVSDAMKI